jgi:hypothetical protein
VNYCRTDLAWADRIVRVRCSFACSIFHLLPALVDVLPLLVPDDLHRSSGSQRPRALFRLHLQHVQVTRLEWLRMTNRRELRLTLIIASIAEHV